MRVLFLVPFALLAAAPPGPDLSAGNLTLLSGTPGAGEAVLLRLVVRNPGPGAAGPFRVKALLSPTLPVTARDAEIGSTEVLSIAEGAEIEVDLDGFVPASAAPGKYHLGAFIDPENLVLDAVRSNNGAATATFTVTRPPAAMELGDAMDAGLGPLGRDGADVPVAAGAEATIRARGQRGVRPMLRIRAPGGGAVLAEGIGGGAALLRWTPPAAAIYRVEVINRGETVGRVRLTTSGRVHLRGVAVTAPAQVPFAAWEDGRVTLTALHEGEAAPLLFRPASGSDVAAPGVARGRRARLGPVVPEVTGIASAVLGGEGPARLTVDSRTTRSGALLVR